MKEVVKNITLLLVSVCLCLGIIEACFRIFMPQALQPASIHEYVNGINNGLRANVKYRWKDTDYDVLITTNSKRLRDREYGYDKKNKVSRILTLGDSYTFGFGVALEETYPKVLERLLGSHSIESRWEVINGGAPGWGTAQQLKFMIAEGIKYKPDILTLCFFENDPDDNINSELYGLKGEQLIHKIPVKNSITRIREMIRKVPLLPYLAENSHFYNFIRRKMLHILYKRISNKNIVKPNTKDKYDQSGSLHYKQLLTIKILNELVLFSKKNSMKLIVFDVPGRLRRFPRIYDYISRTADKKTVFLLDTMHYFNKHAVYEKSTYLRDGHWNSLGHKLAAEMIYTFMKSEK